MLPARIEILISVCATHGDNWKIQRRNEQKSELRPIFSAVSRESRASKLRHHYESTQCGGLGKDVITGSEDRHSSS